MTWFPVVFTFSFTSKELQNQPLTNLQDRFEQLDIKLLTDYNTKYTTHVVSKKRNTAKGLQALICGKYIVTESFLDAVVQAAEPIAAGEPAESSPLEQDFRGSWPDALQHLPPRGGEPVQHPDEIYTPDSERAEVFEGYTFIFYDQTQYNNLLAPITNGGGKALHCAVEPAETQVDDFIRYVRGVAGEKGLGSFEDGSEGKGVVLVRYLPTKGDQVQWYTEFFTTVSLRLDHRPIEQNEFLEAILIKDASILRRPLQIESPPQSQDESRPPGRRAAEPASHHDGSSEASQGHPNAPETRVAPPKAKPRRAVKRRFAGFDDGEDISMTDDAPAPEPNRGTRAEDEGGLFVSQEPDIVEQPEYSDIAHASPRKRQASVVMENDLMEGMAPAAARFKRQRIARGDTMQTADSEPPAEMEKQAVPAKPAKKIKKELDVLAVAAQNRAQEEARAQAEKEDLANLPDDVDLAEIRRLNIVEEMPVRQPAGTVRNREQDIADGRWDPKWNGMKNFKKFRPRGEANVGRPPVRSIVSLTEVKNKEFGIGDDYWLEDGANQKKKGGSQSSAPIESQNSSARPVARPRAARVIASSSDDEDNEEDQAEETAASQGRAGRGSGTANRNGNNKSQVSRQTSQGQSQNKRLAPEPAKEQPPKRPRPTRKVIKVTGSDDSDDDLKFRFGRRR